MNNNRTCGICGATAEPDDRYCGDCGGSLLVDPHGSWPTATPTHDVRDASTAANLSAEPTFVPLDLPPDTGVDAPTNRFWLSGLLPSRSRTA